MKKKIDMKQLDPHSTDIFYESWVDNHYPERPDELENMHLHDFVRHFDIVKTAPVSRRTHFFLLYRW